MASGDTIAGKIRVAREPTEGGEERVLGPLSQDRVDYVNNTVDAEEKLYVNTALASSVSKPSGAESRTVSDAVWYAGEVLRVQHQANSGSTNFDYDRSDNIEIDGVIKDRNRGLTFPYTLTPNDQELSANASTSTSSWVTIFEYTVPDRQRFTMAGVFGAAAIEP